MSSGGFPKSKVVLGGWLGATLLVLPLCSIAGSALSPGSLPDVTTPEDTPTLPIPVRFETVDNSRSLSFLVKSSNPLLVPEDNVQFRGTTNGMVMVVTPAANEAGKSLISICATDGITSATQSFRLTVTAANDAPTLSKISDQVILESASSAAIAITVGDVETPSASLLLTAVSSDPDLLPNGGIVIAGTGSARTLTATPKPGWSGKARVIVTVSDGEASTSREFEVRIGNVNHAPVANAGPDQTVFGTNATCLNGSATDETSNSLTTWWSVVAGSSGVRFANPASLNSSVQFALHGVYTLRLSVSDGELSDTDDITIVVAGSPMARTEEAE
jgi:hypothetical protein